MGLLDDEASAKPVAWSEARMPQGGGLLGQSAGGGDDAGFMDWFTKLPWYQEFQQNYGERPNPNDPQYDYRAAWRAGIQPERYEYDGGRYHWPSTTQDGTPLKGADHPTMWMQKFMQQTGIDPNALGLRSPDDAAVWLKTNGSGR
jgi:hypothetical protein